MIEQERCEAAEGSLVLRIQCEAARQLGQSIAAFVFVNRAKSLKEI